MSTHVHVVFNMETSFPCKYCLFCLAVHTSSDCHCDQNVNFLSIFHPPFHSSWLNAFSVISQKLSWVFEFTKCLNYVCPTTLNKLKSRSPLCNIIYIWVMRIILIFQWLRKKLTSQIDIIIIVIKTRFTFVGSLVCEEYWLIVIPYFVIHCHVIDVLCVWKTMITIKLNWYMQKLLF